MEGDERVIIALADVADVPGKTLTGADGGVLGTIDAVYAVHTGGPVTFARVLVSASHDETFFVPLAEAVLVDDVVAVPYSAELIEGAPRLGSDGELEWADEGRLYEHYGVGDAGVRGESPQSEDDSDQVRGWDDGDRA